ncbi:MAG TPA: hypothetical protein VF042_05680 [Gemmatimonadaceae bacterium]
MSVTPAAGAQARTSANCSYQECALGLAPAWDGIEITRGDSQRRVGSLGFFFPQDITSAFAGDPEAVDVARDAFRIRQAAAILTDAGIVLVGTGVARALFQREFDGLSTTLTAVGGVSFLGGVPLQFAADGALSRAVWLFNRRFAR